MKKRNLNFLLALLAALALVFAGACSDGTDDASGGDDGVISQNATAIGALLDAITDEVDSGITDAAWAFKAGAASAAASGWNAGSATYTLLLANGDNQGADQPVLATALDNVQELGTDGVLASEDGNIRVLFSAAAAATSNTAVASNKDDYRLTVPVVIGDDAGTITVVLPYSVVSSSESGWKANGD